jgi:uncharacterized membrane protein
MVASNPDPIRTEQGWAPAHTSREVTLWTIFVFAPQKRKTVSSQGLSELTKPATILCNYLMPDEPPPPPPVSDSPKSTGLPSNIAAALACIPLIGGIVFFILEKHDPFVRFYSMQSIVFGLAWFLFNVVSAIVHAIFSAIPGIGGILVFFWAIIAAIVHIAFVVLWIIATVKAFTGVRWDIPYVGPIARKQVGET